MQKKTRIRRQAEIQPAGNGSGLLFDARSRTGRRYGNSLLSYLLLLLLLLLQSYRLHFCQLLLLHHLAADSSQCRSDVVSSAVAAAAEHVTSETLAGRLGRHEREVTAETQDTSVCVQLLYAHLLDNVTSSSCSCGYRLSLSRMCQKVVDWFRWNFPGGDRLSLATMKN